MKDQSAVSPVIGTLLVLAMFMVTTATIVAVVRPEIVEYQERGKVDVVGGQMANVIADVRHLAISGNPAEIRQPVLSLPGGTFELEKGHTFATTIGYYGNSSVAVAGTNKAAGNLHGFHVAPAAGTGDPNRADVVDGSDQAVQATFHHTAYTASPLPMAFKVARWDSEDWNEIATGQVAMADQDVHTLGFGPTWTVGDGPIRIQFYNLSATPDALVADIYLYEQTSLSYRFSGESGPRSIYGENGGLIQGNKGRYSLVQSSLIRPPDTDIGNELFSLRSARLNATGAASAAGSTQIGLVMRVNVTENFVYDGGASHVRMQFWGHHPAAWEKQLLARGFTDDSALERGVYWFYEKTSGRYWSFPVHLIDSQIDVRLTSR